MAIPRVSGDRTRLTDRLAFFFLPITPRGDGRRCAAPRSLTGVSVLELRRRLFERLDRLGLAFLGQLVAVDDQRQALLVAEDNSSLRRQVVA